MNKAIVAVCVMYGKDVDVVMPNRSIPNMIGRSIAFTDCTDMYMDEVRPLAERFGLYGAYMESKSNLDGKKLKKYSMLLQGHSLGEVEGMMTAEPFEGARGVIHALKNSGYEVHVISDNPLLTLPGASKKLYQLGIGYIHPTIKLDVRNGCFTGYLDSYRPKEEIVMEVVRKMQPDRIIGIGHANNDRDMLEIVKDLEGTTIAIGKELEADHNVNDLDELARLIPMLP
ncbi:MAG: hypothetical protein V1887_02200 [Candidatus Aenigmatarchaeota archaeon]